MPTLEEARARSDRVLQRFKNREKKPADRDTVRLPLPGTVTPEQLASFKEADIRSTEALHEPSPTLAAARAKADRVLEKYKPAQESSSAFEKVIHGISTTERLSAQGVDRILQKLGVEPDRYGERTETLGVDPSVKGYTELFKKYGILEEHPYLQAGVGFAAGILGDPLTYVPFGLLYRTTKLAPVAKKGLGLLATKTPFKKIIPAVGTPDEYKFARLLARHTQRRETDQAIKASREMAKKMTRTELKTLGHIYEATKGEIPFTLDELNNLAYKGILPKERIAAWLDKSAPSLLKRWETVGVPTLRKWKEVSENLGKQLKARGIIEEEIQGYVPHLYKDMLKKPIATMSKQRKIETLEKGIELGYKPIEDFALQHAFHIAGAKSAIIQHDFIQHVLNNWGKGIDTEVLDTGQVVWKIPRGAVKEGKEIFSQEDTLLLAVKRMGGITPKSIRADYGKETMGEIRRFPGLLRKKGRNLDEMVLPLKDFGFHFESGDDLLNALLTPGKTKGTMVREFAESVRAPVQVGKNIPFEVPEGYGLYIWKGSLRQKPFSDAQAEVARKNLLATAGDLIDANSLEGKTVVGMLGKDAKAYLLPKSIFDDLEKTRKFMKEDIGEFMRWHNKALGVWKGLATFSVGFHVRNFMGDHFNMWLGGLQPQDVPVRYAQAVKVMKGAPGVLKSRAGREFTYKELQEFTHNLGFYEGSLFGEEIANSLWDGLTGLERAVRPHKLSKANPLMYSRKLGQAGEQTRKIVYFLDRLTKGDNVPTAFLRTKKYLFDYSDLTDVERKYGKAIVPFYTWMRNNIPLQIEALFTQPWKIKSAFTLPEITPAPEEERALFPNYFQTRFAVRTPLEHRRGPVYVLPDMPPSDLLELGLAADVLGRLSPFIAATAMVGGSLTGKEEPFKFFTHGIPPGAAIRTPWAAWLPKPVAKILDVYPEYDRKMGEWTWKMPAKYAEPIQDLIPPLSRAGRMSTGDWLAIGSFFFGMSALDEEKQQRRKFFEERREKGEEKKERQTEHKAKQNWRAYERSR